MTNEKDDCEINESVDLFLTVLKKNGEWGFANYYCMAGFDDGEHSNGIKRWQKLEHEVVYTKKIRFSKLDFVRNYMSVVVDYVFELSEEGTFELEELEQRIKNSKLRI